jgi:hypothetical protein
MFPESPSATIYKFENKTYVSYWVRAVEVGRWCRERNYYISNSYRRVQTRGKSCRTRTVVLCGSEGGGRTSPGTVGHWRTRLNPNQIIENVTTHYTERMVIHNRISVFSCAFSSRLRLFRRLPGPGPVHELYISLKVVEGIVISKYIDTLNSVPIQYIP